MEERLYWLWLQGALGVGARTDEITAVFPSPAVMYGLSKEEWRLSGVLTLNQIEKLSTYPLENVQGIVEYCNNKGYRITTYSDPDYPVALRSIANPPLVLFVKGDLTAVNEKVNISIVGTRKASLEGSTLAYRCAAALSLAGINVVSGAALGIDSAAHRGALCAGGPTTAVLGCGFDAEYLIENRAMREKIASVGALISEFPPKTPASRRTFPIRNRIISGLSSATIVVEAGLKSGSLITATRAGEQGREIFAPPGEVFNSSYAGANQLIRDGARPMFSVYDVIEEYSLRFPDKISPQGKARAFDFLFSEKEKSAGEQLLPSDAALKQEKKPARKARSEKPKEPKPTEEKKEAKSAPLPEDLSESAAVIFGFVGEEPTSLDELQRRSGIPQWQLSSALTELEINGLVSMCPGNRCKRATKE